MPRSSDLQRNVTYRPKTHGRLGSRHVLGSISAFRRFLSVVSHGSDCSVGWKVTRWEPSANKLPLMTTWGNPSARNCSVISVCCKLLWTKASGKCKCCRTMPGFFNTVFSPAHQRVRLGWRKRYKWERAFRWTSKGYCFWKLESFRTKFNWLEKQEAFRVTQLLEKNRWIWMLFIFGFFLGPRGLQFASVLLLGARVGRLWTWSFLLSMRRYFETQWVMEAFGLLNLLRSVTLPFPNSEILWVSLTLSVSVSLTLSVI